MIRESCACGAHIEVDHADAMFAGSWEAHEIKEWRATHLCTVRDKETNK